MNPIYDASTEIGVDFINCSDSQPTVYLRQKNKMVLRLTNKTGGPINVSPAEPANPPPDGGAFEVLVFLSRFNPVGGDATLAVTAPGWQSKYFPDRQFPCWSLAAVDHAVWQPDSALEFTVANLEPAADEGHYYISLTLCNLNGVYQLPRTKSVGVANPPGTLLDLGRYVTPTLDHASVTISKTAQEPVRNKYALTLLNTRGEELVPANTPRDHEHPPKFTLFFEYADPTEWGKYLLTTTELAASIEVGIENDAGQNWKQPIRVNSDAGPSWLLTPTEANHAILSGRDELGVTFSIGHVVTQLPAGPTFLTLQYNNIPGYADGYLSTILTKVYRRVEITEFSINKPSLSVDDPTPPTLTWQVDNSVLVELFTYGLVSSHRTEFPVAADHDQTLVLTAFDPFTNTIVSRCIDFKVEPPMSARWLPCGTITVWSGDASSIPPGFALCDGTRGTPDLRDRFVVAAGNTIQPGTAGTSTHTHEHHYMQTLPTSEVGAHSHGLPIYSGQHWYRRDFFDAGNGGFEMIDTSYNLNGGTSVPENGLHNHVVSATFDVHTGNNQDDLRPPWYALCYIMKLYPFVKFQHDETDLVWSLDNGGTNKGTEVTQATNSPSDDQRWILQDAGNGSYRILNRAARLYLTVSYGEQKPGAKLIIWPHNADGVDQKWFLERINGNLYRIRSAGTNLYISVDYGSIEPGAHLVLWEDQGNRDQRWCRIIADVSPAEAVR
ncbi:MAG TPA: RICIN domain-containing protein [Acidimicrobiales bacterium]|jgi:hypothetical protein|nr:RICIN domain-containing protein [Acidimicrobiales bacterium]